jgi:hypothetical protein
MSLPAASFDAREPARIVEIDIDRPARALAVLRWSDFILVVGCGLATLGIAPDLIKAILGGQWRDVAFDAVFAGALAFAAYTGWRHVGVIDPRVWRSYLFGSSSISATTNSAPSKVNAPNRSSRSGPGVPCALDRGEVGKFGCLGVGYQRTGSADPLEPRPEWATAHLMTRHEQQHDLREAAAQGRHRRRASAAVPRRGGDLPGRPRPRKGAGLSHGEAARPAHRPDLPVDRALHGDGEPLLLLRRRPRSSSRAPTPASCVAGWP